MFPGRHSLSILFEGTVDIYDMALPGFSDSNALTAELTTERHAGSAERPEACRGCHWPQPAVAGRGHWRQTASCSWAARPAVTGDAIGSDVTGSGTNLVNPMSERNSHAIN